MRRRGVFAAIICLLTAIGAVIAVRALAVHAPLPIPTQKADSILILKKDHILELLAGGKIIKTYQSRAGPWRTRAQGAGG
jgi:hypothetical protein